MRNARPLVHVVAAIGLTFSLSASAAISVVFEVHDVADTRPGEDRWQYQYVVSGAFQQFDELNVFFDAGLASAILPGAAPNGDWTVSVAQPIAGIPADGIFTADAEVTDPSLAQPFVVDFVRVGSALPGAQAFEVLDENFDVKASGITSPVPEPASYVVLAAGLIVLGARRFIIASR
ncbi:MAG: PEP-CTERM sorting domain-containing protein [Burkholderiales bacterium]|nr:PEP-CTERM sorting domain-containing protein [Burkholderiales bacterium]